MKTIKILVAATVLLFAACAQPDTNSVEAKKKQLMDINQQIDNLKAEAKKLESEIAKLDTSAAGALKTKTVKVEEVAPSEFNNFIEVQGSVDSDENVLANSTMPGVVTAINVKEGDVVSKGQILATTDNSVLTKSIDQLQVNLDLATTAYDKQKRLWDQKIGSEMQYLSAKAQKENLEKQLRTLNTQIELSYVKSPINGVVDEVKLKIGEMAAPGMTGIRVVNINNIKVKAKVSDNYISKIKKGQQVVIRFPDIDYEVKAPVTFTSSVIGNNRSFMVEVKINNSNGMIKPNMIANLLIEDSKIANALVIPSNAVEHTPTGNYVMVATVDGGKKIARRQKVEIGVEYNGQTIVKEGIKAGDKIITFGYQDIVDGQPINY